MLLYEAWIGTDIYKEVLHGLVTGNSDTIEKQARSTAKTTWKFLTTENEQVSKTPIPPGVILDAHNREVIYGVFGGRKV